MQEEENGPGSGSERVPPLSFRPETKGPPRSYCDPRHWFSAAEAEIEEPAEGVPRRPGTTQEISLLGNSHGSVVQQHDLAQPKTVIATPIYKPSGSMRSTRI